MPRPLPPSLSEPEPEQQGGEPAPAEILRVLGGVGLPDDAAASRLDDPGWTAEDAGNGWERIAPSLALACQVVQLAGSGLDQLKLSSPDLANVNWSRLQETAQVYKTRGIATELVITPEGQSLDFWREVFSKLRAWQEAHHPDTTYRLQRRDENDGLEVGHYVTNNWSDLVRSTTPRWTASVIPVTRAPVVVSVDHRGFDKHDIVWAMSATLQDLLQALPSKAGLLHPSPESYLMLQAGRFLTKQAPLDSSHWTWLDGSLPRDSAPAACWNWDIGKVTLSNLRAVGIRDTGLGVRPSGKGV